MKLKKIFEENFINNPELKQDLNNLTKSLPFITIKMGLDLYELSLNLDKSIYQNKTEDEFYKIL